MDLNPLLSFEQISNNKHESKLEYYKWSRSDVAKHILQSLVDSFAPIEYFTWQTNQQQNR